MAASEQLMRWTPYGGDAILLHFAEEPGEEAFQKCIAIVEALELHAPPRVVEFVPGYTSILFEFERSAGFDLDDAAQEMMEFCRGAIQGTRPPGPVKRIGVRYDGPDLERVARQNEISPDLVVEYHAAPIYQVLLLGFAPGFPYLGGLHPKLATPRLAAPRPSVPAGSVAIGGTQTGIYSVPMPGGWNLIGRTETIIFDAGSVAHGIEEGAFFLRQGDRVQFFPV